MSAVLMMSATLAPTATLKRWWQAWPKAPRPAEFQYLLYSVTAGHACSSTFALIQLTTVAVNRPIAVQVSVRTAWARQIPFTEVRWPTLIHGHRVVEGPRLRRDHSLADRRHEPLQRFIWRFGAAGSRPPLRWRWTRGTR